MVAQQNFTANKKAQRSEMLSKVVTLANNLVGLGWNRSEAMKEAHRQAGNLQAAKYVKWTKKDGRIATRVVFENWADYQPAKGGKATNPYWKVADYSKVLNREAGKAPQGYYSVVISIIEENIINLR